MSAHKYDVQHTRSKYAFNKNQGIAGTSRNFCKMKTKIYCSETESKTEPSMTETMKNPANILVNLRLTLETANICVLLII